MTEAYRNFLDLADIPADDLQGIIAESKSRKEARAGLPKGTVDEDRPLDGRILAMVFDKPSTRTRVSFDVGIRQLGGSSIVLNGGDIQIERGETRYDTGRVLSGFTDAIMYRTHDQAFLDEMASGATVPVINGLSDMSHPCQLMADVLTLEEQRGPVAEQTITWVGDGNNMAYTWVQGAALFGYKLRVSTPDELAVDSSVLKWAADHGADVVVTEDPQAAVEGTDCVVADCWVSMGDKDAAHRHNMLQPYQVDDKMMALAAKDAVFMHCLPAHRGEEVTADVIDGPQSIVFPQAENRLHAQKGVLNWCLKALT